MIQLFLKVSNLYYKIKYINVRHLYHTFLYTLINDNFFNLKIKEKNVTGQFSFSGNSVQIGQAPNTSEEVVFHIHEKSHEFIMRASTLGYIQHFTMMLAAQKSTETTIRNELLRINNIISKNTWFVHEALAKSEEFLYLLYNDIDSLKEIMKTTEYIDFRYSKPLFEVIINFYPNKTIVYSLIHNIILISINTCLIENIKTLEDLLSFDFYKYFKEPKNNPNLRMLELCNSLSSDKQQVDRLMDDILKQWNRKKVKYNYYDLDDDNIIESDYVLSEIGTLLNNYLKNNVMYQYIDPEEGHKSVKIYHESMLNDLKNNNYNVDCLNPFIQTTISKFPDRFYNNLNYFHPPSLDFINKIVILSDDNLFKLVCSKFILNKSEILYIHIISPEMIILPDYLDKGFLKRCELGKLIISISKCTIENQRIMFENIESNYSNLEQERVIAYSTNINSFSKLFEYIKQYDYVFSFEYNTFYFTKLFEENSIKNKYVTPIIIYFKVVTFPSWYEVIMRLLKYYNDVFMVLYCTNYNDNYIYNIFIISDKKRLVYFSPIPLIFYIKLKEEIPQVPIYDDIELIRAKIGDELFHKLSIVFSHYSKLGY